MNSQRSACLQNVSRIAFVVVVNNAQLVAPSVTRHCLRCDSNNKTSHLYRDRDFKSEKYVRNQTKLFHTEITPHVPKLCRASTPILQCHCVLIHTRVYPFVCTPPPLSLSLGRGGWSEGWGQVDEQIVNDTLRGAGWPSEVTADNSSLFVLQKAGRIKTSLQGNDECKVSNI